MRRLSPAPAALHHHIALAAETARLRRELGQAREELRDSRRTLASQGKMLAVVEMTGAAIHEIGNALATMLLSIDVLREGERQLPSKALLYLDSIRLSGIDMAHTLERLREISGPGGAPAPLESVDVNRVAQQAAYSTCPRWHDMPGAKGAGVEVSLYLGEEIPLLRGDESDLRGALVNLLLNAVDAMPDGGTVSIRTRVAEDPEHHCRVVHVEVTDTGAGMDVETRRRCLEPYFSTKGPNGNGLGLVVVSRFVERYGGELYVTSAPGEGTTFRLSLPVPDVELNS